MRYEFVIAARLSDTVVAAFPELKVSERPGTGTTLFGPVTDRAHLDGLLAQFSDLGLELVDMHRLPD
ncbi:hypothetical protein PSU4_00380 [Pseudonocardia sulfidoxydans NBRC 16205]|uniref:Uncharacterized protein n=1 Tax=Pseudonocardia sulfidoxydans NBRC 16205 TaxID=1223511 RepID=A0A511DBQ0_9PSEU|nr:hypothetical protein [Pseudonocardia sulfidoxydans]GEL21084.1 hypothetical protein PSU4_00380 [Pseudonocardia sulfidoxydans NBRC 16205]